MEQINNEVVMTSKYVDKIGISQMVEMFQNDEEIGIAIRKYISQCKEHYINDGLFPIENNIGKKPSDYFKAINK